jgi:MFS family permease
MDRTKRQWLTLTVLSTANFFSAMCVSLQAPFFPAEAEKKGATASEYGFIFGIFELVGFLTAPLYGHYMKNIGVKKLYNVGIFTAGIAVIIFGTLDQIQGHYAFISSAFTCRIIEAAGTYAFFTSSFAIIAVVFPNNIATTFAAMESFFGVGLIFGPVVSSWQIGSLCILTLIPFCRSAKASTLWEDIICHLYF